MSDSVAKTWLIAGLPQALAAELESHLSQRGHRTVCANEVSDPILDPTTADAWDALFARAEQTAGPVSVLVVGIAAVNDENLEDMTLAQFRHDNEMNIVGNFLGVQAAFRAFAGRGGHIVTVASAHGRRGQLNSPSLCAASNGIGMLTRTSAIEGAQETPRIHVNGVLVGNSPLWPSIPVGDTVSLDEIAAAIAFLGGPGADYMTGALVPVGAPGP